MSYAPKQLVTRASVCSAGCAAKRCRSGAGHPPRGAAAAGGLARPARKHVAVSRQALRKLLDRERFVFYPKGRGDNRWYELAVKPSLERFFGAVPTLKKAMASPTGFVR